MLMLEDETMVRAIMSRFSEIISLLVIISLLSIPAYAKYSGGTGVTNDPYQIATAEDLMLLGDSPEDYNKNFILTAARAFTFAGAMRSKATKPGPCPFGTSMTLSCWQYVGDTM